MSINVLLLLIIAVHLVSTHGHELVDTDDAADVVYKRSCADKAGQKTCYKYKTHCKQGSSNYAWMMKYCALTCSVCSSSTATQSCKDLGSQNTCTKYKDHCRQGKRYYDWMTKNCARTCKACGSPAATKRPTTKRPMTKRPTTKKPPTTVAIETCKDLRSQNTCTKYKDHCRQGKRYYGWMTKNCARTCGACGSPAATKRPTTKRPTTKKPPTTVAIETCKDLRSQNTCTKYKAHCRKGKRYYDWMTKNCARTCGACGSPAATKRPTTKRPTTKKPPTTVAIETCKDASGASHSCRYWKGRGYCDENSEFYESVIEKCSATCGICTPKPTKPVIKDRAVPVSVDLKECLEAHNSKRALHGASPLVWNRQLAVQAEAWALKLARYNMFKHARDRNGAGENLYSRYNTEDFKATCAEAVKSWYSEIEDYPFHSPPESLGEVSAMIGHFTQIVWKATEEVGVGIARITRSSNGQTYYYVVARYLPPGNYQGRFAENVGRLRG